MRRIKLFEEFKADSRMQEARIGVYHDLGVTDGTFQVWQNLIVDFFSTNAIDVNTDNLSMDLLNSFDLLIIPGGDSFQERLGMNENNVKNIMEWCSNGGKILAVCAGFHLIAKGRDWSLGMVDIKSSNTGLQTPASQPVRRVTDDIVAIDFEITESGKALFSTQKDSVNLYFHGGPICDEPNKDIQVLLRFKSGVPMQIPGENYTVDKVAGTFSRYDKGQIIALSPHFEKTPEEKDMLANAIKHLVMN